MENIKRQRRKQRFIAVLMLLLMLPMMFSLTVSALSAAAPSPDEETVSTFAEPTPTWDPVQGKWVFPDGTVAENYDGTDGGGGLFGFLGNLKQFVADILATSTVDFLKAAFTTFNAATPQIATDAGFVPMAPSSAMWAEMPNMINTLSETVFIPVAGVILTFVLVWEFYEMIIQKNNMAEIGGEMFFKWIMRALIAIMLVSYAHVLVNAFFEVGQQLAGQIAGLLGEKSNVTLDALKDLDPQAIAANYMGKNTEGKENLGGLFSVWFAAMLFNMVMNAVGWIVTIVMAGRIIEIYLVVSIAPMPIASMTNRSWGIGQSYLKRIMGLVLQGLFLMILLAMMYVVANETVRGLTAVEAGGAGLMEAIYKSLGYFILLGMAMFSSKTLANSIVGSH